MARRYLYHVTPTRNVGSILRTGLEPRAGEWRSQKWPPRVWLATGVNAAYMLAEIFMFEGRYDCWLSPNSKDSTENHYWKKIGKDGEETGLKVTGDPATKQWLPLRAGEDWKFVRGETLSIVILERTKIDAQIHPNDLGDFHYRCTARKRQLATVWTGDPIPPEAIVDIRQADMDYLKSAPYRRYVGDTPATARERAERTPRPYLPVISKKGIVVGIKRNKKVGLRRGRSDLKPS
jgi:hypothetical protein